MYTTLAKKDTVKAQLRAQKSINMQLQKKGGPAEAGIFLNMGMCLQRSCYILHYVTELRFCDN